MNESKHHETATDEEGRKKKTATKDITRSSKV
jgi:hypothetical protein